MLARGRFSRAPSPYPSLLFHAIRLVQLVSATIVMSFLAFFVHYLLADHYYIPWTFLVLLAVSSFTVGSVIVTAFFYHYRTLRPRLSSLINGGSTVIWMLGFALLTWNLSGTLSNACNVDNWDHETGVMVCRIYKAIETFTITGLLSTASSLALDLYILRKTRERGVYNVMPDTKRPGGPQGYVDRLNNPHHHTRSVSNANMPLASGAEFSHRVAPVEEEEGDGFGAAPTYREPSLEFPEYSHEAKRPYKAQRAMEAERFGYRVPEEQTSYEGASARMLDRQFAEHES